MCFQIFLSPCPPHLSKVGSTCPPVPMVAPPCVHVMYTTADEQGTLSACRNPTISVYSPWWSVCIYNERVAVFELNLLFAHPTKWLKYTLEGRSNTLGPLSLAVRVQ